MKMEKKWNLNKELMNLKIFLKKASNLKVKYQMENYGTKKYFIIRRRI